MAMSLPISLKFPATPPHPSPALPPPRSWGSGNCRIKPLRLGPTSAIRSTRWRTQIRTTIARAVEGSQESAEPETRESEPEETASPSQPAAESNPELSELGAEIKKAMEQRKERAEGDLLSGVGEEIREIEWPAFGKVLSTTGIVLGVIAGTSVVLLTVNAVLAELSDKVFAGKGVQDFFG